VLNRDLRFLNLSYHSWIGNNFINKIGYFAANLEELALAGTLISDEVLIELARSCQQYNKPNLCTL